jgi:hypothetical protein
VPGDVESQNTLPDGGPLGGEKKQRGIRDHREIPN